MNFTVTNGELKYLIPLNEAQRQPSTDILMQINEESSSSSYEVLVFEEFGAALQQDGRLF